MASPPIAYHPRVGRLVVLNAVGIALEVAGLWLTNQGATSPVAPLRPLGLVLLVVAIPMMLSLLPPLLQGVVRRSATVEVREDGMVLALGFDQKRKVSWSDVSSVACVRLKRPLAVGWVTIGFTRPRQAWGREVSLPDLYLDRGVEEVAGAMQERLERWRNPFGRPGGS